MRLPNYTFQYRNDDNDYIDIELPRDGMSAKEIIDHLDDLQLKGVAVTIWCNNAMELREDKPFAEKLKDSLSFASVTEGVSDKTGKPYIRIVRDRRSTALDHLFQ